ncbi:hypothetical protein NliqN6_6007 [Naganishia liquefaciens]|uniref:Uncharacterized protein n=1 Tax=Naganishia liquefaciens TaxID=104408 RepID=A0A8H3YH60_9TREE|nr:hypothetical protein NliqN6_6007 [Naganishia liquefaciens]
MSRRSSTSTLVPGDPLEEGGRRRPSPLGITALGLALLAGAGTFVAWPFPTTVPVLIAFITGACVWCVGAWGRVVRGWIRARREDGYARVPQEWGEKVGRERKRAGKGWGLGCVTVLMVLVLWVGVVPPEREMSVQTNAREPVFIAANLYNVQDIWDEWRDQVVNLINHLGKNTTYLSIYESNSSDSTSALLTSFASHLTSLGIPHRIITEQTSDRQWPHNASAKRIAYLARARNRALEPLRSGDAPGWERGKVVFLNDVVFEAWQVVDLLDSRIEGQEGEYDLACGMDYGWSGMYDTWVARDACGTPLRPFWPYVQDPPSVDKIRNEDVFEVASCWNGVVAFRAGLVAREGSVNGGTVGSSEDVEMEVAWDAQGGTSSVDATEASLGSNGTTDAFVAGGTLVDPEARGRALTKRGWQMVDNATDPQSRHSPPVQLPLSFRTSHLDACDHSECFLFSYDLHRLYPTKERPPRILMNPGVKVAYERRWWVWHNVVLEIPVIKLWIRHWSRGYPLMFVDWIWESAGRRRDYCTWAGLSPHLPERCPALPGAEDRTWDQG